MLQASTPDRSPPPIAIVGMACRLPGGVNSPEELYRFLLEKKDGLCEVPSTRYTIDSFYNASSRGAIKTRHGYFLQEDPMLFDAPFFSITDYEAERMDPQQRQLLEVVWECLESAGETNWKGKNIGCYVGVYGEDWLDLASKDPQATSRYHVLGTGQFALANRLSYEYDFQGPSMTLQTGCSASMIGLHEACQSIYSGDSCAAIVAGTNLILAPTMTVTMSDNGVLSPTGTCKTFDAKADGYGRAEAVNVLYIKALQDAILDKNPIRAIIRATTTNSDGKTPSITTPGSKSQEVLVRRAYEKAGIEDIGQTGFFECHGTGTVAGDTVETSAVAKLFKGKGVVIGAVKPNVGHSEGASAITSIIKAVVSLENKTIPQIYRVSVNSFGIGGANGHVILDSSSSFHGKVTSPPEGSLDENSRLLVVSAGSAESLQKRIEQIIEHANSNPSILHDLAYTLGSRREHLSHRAFTVAQQNGPISSSNFQSAVDVTPELVWVFTGQGAQWAGMGRDLIRAFPIASDCIRQLTKTLQQLPDGPSWLLQEELSKEGRGSRVNAAEFSQPLCTALQIALIDVLHSWGIRPSSVVGHSSGEIAAAYAAGAITAQSAIIIAYYRGLAAKRQDGTGAMAAVGLSAEDVQPYLQDGVVIACHNSPCSVTLSGDPPAMDTVVNRIKSEFPDVLCRRLKVSIAYHSHHMHELGQNYEASIAPYIQVTDQMLPLYSSVRAACITQPSELNATYWRSNLQSPVLFVDAVRGVLAASSPVGRAFLEIGPHSALSAPLRQTFHSEGAKPKFVYISTLIRNAGETRDQLLNTAGSLHVNGVSVNLQEINGEGLTLSNLPLYPWQHTTRYLQESRLTRKWRFRVHPHHELLGDRVVESSDWEPSWRNILRLKDVPWIEEHILQGNIIFPATGYIAMIGEAISQLDTSQDGYSIRDLIIKTPLLLRDSDEVEILTTLKQARISDITDSEWYTFSIMSHDSTDDSWIKHCHGRVRAGVEHAPKFREIKPYARSVDVNRCYRRFERFGFAYGNVFRGLRSISIHPTEHRASGTVADMGDKRSRHTLHPATMDSHLQMFNVLTERDQDASMGAIIPAAMGEVYVRGSAAQISFEGGLSKTSSGQSLGDIVGTAGDQILFSVSGLFGFPLSLPQNCKASQQLCSQIRWMPDIDMVPPNAMLRGDQGLERNQLWQDASRLCEVYIMETYDRLKDVTAVSDHLRRWQQWITTEAIRLRQQDNSAQPKSQVGDSMGSRQETISRIMLDHANRRGTHPILFECIGQIMENCDRIVLGQVSALDVLEIEGRLERYNEWLQSQCDWSYFLSLLGHSNPTIRVLEIGSGTGASTIAVLQHLRSPEGVRHYSQYTVTEAREASLKAVQKNLQHNEDLTYTLLDISVDPEAQGFDLHSYDLIIASNLHTAPRLGTALQHIRQLLAPNGRLLLHELCPGTLITEYLMGSLTQWSSAKDFRVNDKPYISRDRWDTELRNAGFIGIEGMAYDVAPPHQTYLTMLSRVPFSQPEAEKYSAVTLLTMGSPGPWANEVASCFREGGCVVNWTTLQDTPRENHWIISLLDLNGPYLNDFSEERYRSLQSFLLETDKSHMIWVTSSSQMDCADPRFGLILGLTRALRHEMPGSISLFETDCYTQQAAGALFKVFEKLQRVRRCSEAAVTESEYSFFQGVTHVSRCHWMHTAQISPRPETQCPRKLDVGSFGLIDTTQWVAIAGHREDLEKGQIEVDVHYVGLNFRDVLVGMGVFGRADELGLEGTGVVHRVASDVKDLQPGDRVMIIGGGLFRTRVVLSATFCRKIPADLALDDAATMGSVYMTAWYCLCHLGRLQNGDIFATVGNEDKAMYLIEEFGIPRNHIFSSRNSDFLPSLMEETQGRGVDIVLNSLSGKLLHTSWECVAPFGRFIEVGKRDFLANGQLAMAPFIENRSYIGFDLFQMGKQNPRAHEQLLQQFQDWYDGGHIKPIRPVTIYEAAKVTDAFRYMQQGSHMGKILIRMPSDPMELAPTSQPPVSFSPNKSYLLVGGLGGVGRSVALWMVQRGARHLVILSRSAGQSDSDRDFILDLEEQGCHVICVAGSVATAADVESAIARCPRPLAGILQMSAVLRDQSFAKMTYDEWSTCLATKVRGTWNLHHAASDQLLDFFIVFSSIAGICGNHGQANYAAANTFLDSFTRYRRRLGLPSATLALGAVEDCGLVSRDAKVLQAMQAASVRLVREDELLEGVELAIRQSNAPFSPPHPAPTASPSTSIGQGITSDACIIGLGNTRSISDPTVRTVWPSADPRFSLYTNIEVKDGQRTTVGGAAFKELLRRVDQNPTMLNDSDVANNLSHELSKHLARHMPRAAEMSAEEVAEMPIDSLMAVEIQRGLRGDLNWDISMVEIAKIGKIGRLAEAAIQHLKKKYGLVREGE
ncbi:type I Iterative Polyketide synthase (PKS) [Aspergillus niger]|nr:type I Iterative Polyketide synthase (PKS) [Aspergillus niger]